MTPAAALRMAAAIAYRHRDEWQEDAADRQRDGELFSRQVARAREAEEIGDEIMAMVNKMEEGGGGQNQESNNH